MRLTLLLCATLASLASAQQLRQGRGLFEDAERLLGHINSGIDTLQVQASREMDNLRPWAKRVEEEMRPAMERVEQTVGGALSHVVDRLAQSTPSFSPFDDVVDRRNDNAEGSGIGLGQPGVSRPLSIDDLLGQFSGQPLDLDELDKV